eukprot:CAMPEP_0171116114 /NCGR_PEP_ID=MMETSP0766_2-20121228/89562_1 /TAXON_ID=439317 /ORGANISM="Gambierdiscus australes, Strain CAWD 149" /LENGTH=302 /DNA_ID=CAMNT_0011578525 /DNA_START=53 /DNA_END=961 /DNA_ORIENTATION=-
MTVLANGKKKDEDALDDDEDDGDVTFDQTPVRVVCPHCGLNVITFIEHESSWVTYSVSIVLLLVLNWAALCVVPVVYPLFKDVVHHCPRCLRVLATRSRVVLPSFKQEVMSFRFGSCVVVLARKYVLLLLALSAIIGGCHFVRTSGTAPSGLDSFTRGELSSLTWEDFAKDCGIKSYLGNPIHVTMAFDVEYKNKTFHWAGAVHHVEQGLSFLWFNQRGALFTNMQPPQFPMKRDMADLMLLYNEGDEVGAQVQKLKRGTSVGFDVTMVEVGKRGAPHVGVLWDVRALPGKNGTAGGSGAAL